ncbi:MAG: hypothetical protein HDR01_14755 [Lachnospiraceae bacterium]|nr:hypothetical protein [Lachnospiraceae bacterium]
MWKSILKAIGFFAVFLLLFLCINSILELKHEDGIAQMEMFYKQKENTIDVICLGSSHVFANIDPAILEEDYGIAAYDLAGSMQPMWNTYYCLKEALKYQKPSLIILDVFRLTEGFTYSKESKVVKNTYGMRISMNKIKSIQESVEKKEDVLRHVFGIATYHDRYYELEEKDFQGGIRKDESYKGYYPLTEIQPQKQPRVSHIEETLPIEEKTKQYFYRILELAQKQDIPVLLINAPYCMTEDDKKVFNELESLLQEGVPGKVAYLDFNRHYSEMGLDFSVDFADSEHLNQEGAKKMNKYLGEYLVNHYGF